MAVSIHRVIGRAEALVFPPAIRLESVQLRAENESAAGASDSGSLITTIFMMVLPGISVWALFLLGDMAMRDILTESGIGTLRRQLVGPIRPGEIVLGKTVFTAVMSTISLIVLAGIGWGIAERPVGPLGFVVLSAALILAVTGYASTVYGLARTIRQGSTLSSILLLAFAFMGGAFVPLDNLPASVQRVAPLSPFYWGTRGYQELILNGAGLPAIWTHVAVLAVLGVVLLSVGSWLLGRRVREGRLA
jgi:ABC-2 type transport system permease protein